MDENRLIRIKRAIEERYNGDVVAYHRDMQRKTSGTLNWNDIRTNALYLPEFEEEALQQIEFQLGYLPPRRLTLPHEPFVRYALYQYEFEHRDFDQLLRECAIMLKFRF